MNMIADPADKKLAEAVKATTKEEAHKAVVAAVKEAKEDVAEEEEAKK